MERRGLINFQANGKTDVFYVEQIFEEIMELSDEERFNIEDSQFDSDKAWVTGYTPRLKPLNIEGDTTVIHGWFKGESHNRSFVITIYVACEMTEELVEVATDEDALNTDRTCGEQREIIL